MRRKVAADVPAPEWAALAGEHLTKVTLHRTIGLRPDRKAGEVELGRFIVAGGQSRTAKPYLGRCYARPEDALACVAELARVGTYLAGLYDLASETPAQPITVNVLVTTAYRPGRSSSQSEIQERAREHWQTWSGYAAYGGRRLHRFARRFMVQWGWGMGSNETRYFKRLPDALAFCAAPRFRAGPGIYGLTDFGAAWVREVALRHTASARIDGVLVEGHYTVRTA